MDTEQAAAADVAVRLVLASLGVWRLSHLVTKEDGPYNVITRARLRLGDRFIGQLADCFACTSLWVAAPAAALVMSQTGRPRDIGLTWLALSGAACLLERLPEIPAAAHYTYKYQPS